MILEKQVMKAIKQALDFTRKDNSVRRAVSVKVEITKEFALITASNLKQLVFIKVYVPSESTYTVIFDSKKLAQILVAFKKEESMEFNIVDKELLDKEEELVTKEAIFKNSNGQEFVCDVLNFYLPVERFALKDSSYYFFNISFNAKELLNILKLFASQKIDTARKVISCSTAILSFQNNEIKVTSDEVDLSLTTGSECIGYTYCEDVELIFNIDLKQMINVLKNIDGTAFLFATKENQPFCLTNKEHTFVSHNMPTSPKK